MQKYFCLFLLILSFFSLLAKPNVAHRLPILPEQKQYNIKDFGAVGDSKTDDAKAIQQTLDACAAAGGGRIIIPSGYTFMTGPFKISHRILC
jgi:polygalacturonase